MCVNTCGVAKDNEEKYGLVSMPKWCSANAIVLLSDRELTTVRIMALEREEKTREKRGGENRDGIEGEDNKMTSF